MEGPDVEMLTDEIRQQRAEDEARREVDDGESAERLAEGLADGDRDVFDGVVGVDVSSL